MNWLDNVKWDAQGLVPVIAQEQGSNDVLMFAWMNREALQKTAELGRAVYFSRSRAKLWFKGEESGHVQTVHEIRLDCDSDVVLLKVTQLGHTPGIACHTGRHSLARERLKYTARPSSAVFCRASRFIQANISTSLLPCSWAMTGTSPWASHFTLSNQFIGGLSMVSVAIN